MDEPTQEDAPAHETVEQKQRRLFGRGRDTGRIEYFSDAVIAIAMTLLVLDIKLPDVPHGGSVFEALGRDWQQFFAYGLSFLVIAINWVFHHRRFRVIVRYDSTLVWINLVFLLLIALVPFPTSLIAEQGPTADVITLYAGMVTVLGVLGGATWAYAHRAGLLSDVVDRPLYVFILVSNLVAPLCFALSIPVAWVLTAAGLDPAWAMWFWVLNWIGSVAWGRVYGARAAGPVTAPTTAADVGVSER